MKAPLHWQDSTWHRVLPIVLIFWLSASLVLDFLVMPVMYTSGMMAESHFVLAGQALFGAFNRMELLLAATICVGFWIKQQTPEIERESMFRNLPIAVILLTIAVLYTYIVTPAMSGMGFIEESTGIIPAGMNTMHGFYWMLESVKLFGLTLLFSRDFQLFH
jgi:Domain of unknown function (DUF4149)